MGGMLLLIDVLDTAVHWLQESCDHLLTDESP